jgi:hypothetical protein
MMKRKSVIYVILSLASLLSFVLTACGGGKTTPTAAPTAAPVAADPTATPLPPFEANLSRAPNCDYGGKIKEIAAPTAIRSSSPVQARPAFMAKWPSSLQINPRGIAENGGGGALLEKPIGTGPYKLDTGIAHSHHPQANEVTGREGQDRDTGVSVGSRARPVVGTAIRHGGLHHQSQPDDYEPVEGDEAMQILYNRRPIFFTWG